MRDPDRLREDVFREVEALRGELVASTSRILQFESISGTAEGPERARHEVEMAACAEFLRELSGRMEFEWRQSPARWYRIEWPSVERGADACAASEKNAPVIGVPVHIDVVPAGGMWAFPPFSGTVADGAVWGRGAIDMKGPLMACLYGLHALKRIGFRPPVTYRLLIGTREEITEWSDIDEYLAAEGAPDFGFTPDACFPVVIGEKGTLVFRVKVAWPATDMAPHVTVIEPVLLRGGTRGNVVPDVCEVAVRFPRLERSEARRRIYEAIARLESDDCEGSVEYRPENTLEAEDGRLELWLVFRGKSAHGSMPERGHNAVLDALQFLQLLELPTGPFTEFVRFLHAAGADLLGGALNLASTHEFIGPTTVNLGVARIGHDGGEGVLNVRPTLGLSVAEAERRIEEAARAFSPEVLREWKFRRIHTAFEPQCLDPEAAAPFLRGLQEGLEAVTGEKAGFRSIPYTTYAKAMPNCCAFGPILHSAGEEEMAHQPDERVTIEALVRNTKIFALALAYAGQNVVDAGG